MRFILNPLTTILENSGAHEVPSGPDSAPLPNISTYRNPRAAARSRLARLRKNRSTTNGASDSKKNNTSTAGTGAGHGARPQGTKYRQGTRRLAGGKPLQRCNTALVPQPVHPQPPGAFITQASFVVPGRPDLDDRNLPPLFAQKLFSDAKVKQDQVLLRASEEQKEREMNHEYARQLEEAHAACRRVEEKVQARMHEGNLRRAEAERLRAMQEEASRQETEDLRKSWEARRRQRRAELEATERARREHECHEQDLLKQHRREQVRLEQQRREQEQLEQHHREQERLVQERREHEEAQSNSATQVRQYEDRWTQLRGNTAGVELLTLNEIPWPWFDYVQCLDDITDERVMEFVHHPVQRHMGPGGGEAKATRFEMLRWHPDQFDGKVLSKVVGEHREIVKAAARRIARILITSNEKMRKP